MGTGAPHGARLVGRDRECAAIIDAVAAAAAEGTGRLLLVVGGAGVGKSRLLHEVTRAAASHGVELATAAADRVDVDRPFRVLAGCLDLRPDHPDPARAALGAGLGRAVGHEAPPGFSSKEPQGGDLGEGVLALLERLVARRPLALVLDDVQWADEASLRSLRPAVRRLDRLPLVVALAFRPSPAPPALRDLAADAPEGCLVDLSVGPLAPHAVADLVRAVTGGTAGPGLLAELDRAAGNPFQVLEVIETLRRQGALVGDGGTVDLAEGWADRATAAAPRLQLLEPSTLELLRVAAVVGSSFAVAELAEVSGRPTAAFLGDLDAALDAGVLEEVDGGGGLRFRHDLLRQALLDELPEAVRRSLHLDAARAAARFDAPPARVAHHLVQGAAPGDRETIEWLHRAARDAAPRDPRAAVALLERAAELAPSAMRSAGLDVDLAEALTLSGRPAEAEALVRAALAAGTDREDALRSVLAEAVFMQGRFADAVEQLELLARAPHGQTPRRLAVAAYGRLLSYDIPGARERGRQALAAAERAGDDEAMALALTALSYLAMVEGDGIAATDLGRRSVEAADRSPDHLGHRFQPALFLAMALDLQDLADEADAALRHSASVSDRIGVGWDAPLRHGTAAGCHFRAGRWDDAVAEAEAGLALSEEHGMELASVLLESQLALVELHRARIGEAEAAVERGEAHIAKHGSRLGATNLYFAKALLLRAKSDDDGALEVLRAIVEITSAVGIIGRNHLLLPDLVQLAAGRAPDVAAAAVEQAEVLAARSGAPSTVAIAHRCRGLRDGDVDELLAAVDAYEGAGRPVELAAAQEDAAFALARAERAQEAQRLAEAALAAYEAVGARLDSARLRTAMQSVGVRLRRRRPPRPSTGWEALTASELRVVDLVADGLSNPEIAEQLFVSRRTVETHLYHVFDKLGVASRVELALAAARRREGA